MMQRKKSNRKWIQEYITEDQIQYNTSECRTKIDQDYQDEKCDTLEMILKSINKIEEYKISALVHELICDSLNTLC